MKPGTPLFGIGGPDRRTCTYTGDVYRRAGNPEPVGNERKGIEPRTRTYREWLDWLADPEHLVAHTKFKGLILDLRTAPPRKRPKGRA